jgi:hypothetical protein
MAATMVPLWQTIMATSAPVWALAGVMLQARLNRGADRERGAADDARHRVQLEQADTQEWRERRLVAYRAVAVAVEELLQSVSALLRGTGPTEVLADRIETNRRQLLEALAEGDLISTASVREAMKEMRRSGARLPSDAQQVLAWAVLVPSDADDLGEVLRRASRAGEGPPAGADPEVWEGLRECTLSMRDHAVALRSAAETWRDEIRKSLGVPD